ncbi:MAG: hypothetical protein IPN71_22210 [Fibrobacteres bacterium]|nr:hypothetical protein [Fibrobacterota bacterium]
MNVRWISSLRLALLASLLFAMSPRAQDTASTFPLFRLSMTMPVITSHKFIGAQFKALGGMPRYAERFGVQGMVAGDVSLGSHPNSNEAMVHLLVGREFSRTGPFSLEVLGGIGFVRDEEWIPPRRSADEGALETSNRPSALIEVDAGVSLWRHIGVGLDAGLALNTRPSAFFGTRVEIGNW